MSYKGGVMNKRVSALALCLIVTGSQFAARSDCFQPYHAEISNKSGGLAIIQKTSNISGLSRRSEIENNTTVKVMVKKAGAELHVVSGPENDKTSHVVPFFCKEPNTLTGHVTLNPKGVETRGFYTENKAYDVKIVNESGGILTILNTVATGIKDHTLADGSSAMLTVRPGGSIDVHTGPENRKILHHIMFAEQTGANPTITFGSRGLIHSGIHSKDLVIAKGRPHVVRSVRKTPARAAAETVVTQQVKKAKATRRVKSNRKADKAA